MYIMLALFCFHFVVNFQGRNFGVKSGGTNSEGERDAPLGTEAREKNGEQVSPPHSTQGSERAS